MNLAHWVRQRAHASPDAVAVRQGGTDLTYAALDRASAAFAVRLRDLGVAPGDRVALVAPNVLAFPVAYYAILRTGGVVVPMNPLLKAGEVAYTWQDSGARVAVVHAMFAGEAQAAAATTGTTVVVVGPDDLAAPDEVDADALEVAEREPEDTAVILYTSGTTGRPKGAELTFANLRSNTLVCVETLFRNGPDDVLFGGLPLFHSFGQTCALNTSVAGGSCLTLLPRFDPREALEVVARDRVTIFLGVPTMYMALLGVADRDAYDTSSVRLGVSGGSSLPVEVLHGVEEAFGMQVLEGYGLSETSPVASFNHPDRPSRAGSVGVPIRGVEMALARPPQEDEDDTHHDEVELLADDPDAIGEIVVRGENVMRGYRGDPAATAEAVRGGWFHTGDLARRDADGYFFIVDRVKDLIIRNGFNVYPREVEEVLYAHPAVAEAAVVGVPDPAHGEEVGALVQLKDGAQASEEELRDFVAQRIAAFKYPRVVRFGPVPKGPTGKILKREIHLER
ncbi:long-chain acyl-CoA synthetase [Microlunatus flavus]|uniref:Long-chain acyl-CoA synthetase n=1 Tax=Microlunatus flavus TaxID=1036181 RepID=A0A1H9LSH3_9ACTN|nr:long-chain acyl-CoA synthetase [Microlunatus flavus]